MRITSPGEMVQQIRALTALKEDPGLVPNTNSSSSMKHSVTPVSEGSAPSSDIPGLMYIHYKYTYVSI